LAEFLSDVAASLITIITVVKMIFSVPGAKTSESRLKKPLRNQFSSTANHDIKEATNSRKSALAVKKSKVNK